MSDELLRIMLGGGEDEPDPDDPLAQYMDRQNLTAGYLLTRYWVPGKAVPLLFAIADKKPTTETGVPREALINFAENVYVRLIEAERDLGWTWKGESTEDPLFGFLIEFTMSLWPDDACKLEWVTDSVLENAQANAETIKEKWRTAQA